MRTNIFPIFITGLGIFTAYVFYALWHTDTMNPSQANNQSISRETTNKEHTKPIASKNTTVKTIPSLATTQNKRTNKEEPSVPSFASESPEEIQESYEALMPESYDNTMIEAQEAFTSLDDAVLEIQEHLDTQMMETEQIE